MTRRKAFWSAVAALLLCAAAAATLSAWTGPWGMQGVQSLRPGVQSWADWDESLESTLNVDFVVFMESTTQSDETGASGRGTVTGTDLVVSVGPSGPAGGDGTKRTYDGTDDRMIVAVGATDAAFKAKTTWTVVAKIRTADPIDTSGKYFEFWDGTQSLINLQHDAAATLKGTIADADNGSTSQTTTATLSAGTDYWIAAWTDGTNTKMGFAPTRPTATTDFTEIKTYATLYDNMASFANRRYLGWDSSVFLGFALYYIVFDSSYLFGG